jgi:hypothetical protein
MINNFKQIRNLLTFPNDNSFYFLEIIKRRKENPEMTRHAKLIKDYYIYSLEQFDKYELDIRNQCQLHNARAYFRLNLRDSKKVAHQFLKRIADLLITEDYKAIPNSYASVTGEYHSDPDKKWLIDIDGEGEDLDHQVTDIVLAIDKITGGNPDTVITKIRTKNGVHLITRPFRLDVFKGEHPTVEVHKDNPTILYVP